MSKYNDGTVQLAGKNIHIELADQIIEQLKGLGGRESLKDDQGMLFVYDRPALRRFWMKGMLIPIDIIWINNDTIAHITPNVQPEPQADDNELTLYSSEEAADKVLELTAGWAEKYGVKVGDKVEINLP